MTLCKITLACCEQNKHFFQKQKAKFGAKITLACCEQNKHFCQKQKAKFGANFCLPPSAL